MLCIYIIYSIYIYSHINIYTIFADLCLFACFHRSRHCKVHGSLLCAAGLHQRSSATYGALGGGLCDHPSGGDVPWIWLGDRFFIGEIMDNHG